MLVNPQEEYSFSSFYLFVQSPYLIFRFRPIFISHVLKVHAFYESLYFFFQYFPKSFLIRNFHTWAKPAF